MRDPLADRNRVTGNIPAQNAADFPRQMLSLDVVARYESAAMNAGNDNHD
jgi:hypothetical protein